MLFCPSFWWCMMCDATLLFFSLSKSSTFGANLWTLSSLLLSIFVPSNLGHLVWVQYHHQQHQDLQELWGHQTLDLTGNSNRYSIELVITRCEFLAKFSNCRRKKIFHIFLQFEFFGLIDVSKKLLIEAISFF